MGNSSSSSSSIMLTPQEAKKLINKNNFDVILDVRTDNEWNNGHHNDAIHIPLDEVKSKFHKLYPDKSIKVLVYCRSGIRAKNAVHILNSQNYNNVYSVNNGSYYDII